MFCRNQHVQESEFNMFSVRNENAYSKNILGNNNILIYIFYASRV